MKIAWLIEETSFDADNIELLKIALDNTDTDYITYKYLPFEHGIEITNNKKVEDYNKVFVYGSLNSVRYIQRKGLILFPQCLSSGTEIITFLNLPEFKCSYYYPRFNGLLLNRDAIFIPYGMLDNSLNKFTEYNIYEHLFNTSDVFIRPDSGWKNFTGRVLSREDYDDYKFWSDYMKPEDLCVIASPVNIDKEYRCIIDGINKTIVSASQYKSVGLSKCKYGMPEKATTFVKSVIENVDYQPDPFWVLDICNLVAWSDDYFVIETNSMSCSGLYECSKYEIVKAINTYLQTEEIL